MKKMVGGFKLKGLSFKFVIGPGGVITIGKFKTKIVLSTSVSFPAINGWFSFLYMKYTYYIRFSNHLEVYRFGASCKSSFKGMKHFCGVIGTTKVTVTHGSTTVVHGGSHTTVVHGHAGKMSHCLK